MPSFQITAPDGKRYEVTGDNAEGALQALKDMLGDNEPIPKDRNLTEELSRQVGLTGRALAEGAAGVAGLVYDPLAYMQNKAFGTEVPPLTEQVNSTLTNIGLPEPENATERVVQMVGQGMTGGGGSVGVARGVAQHAQGLTKGVATLAEALPGAQVVSGGGGGAGQQLASEAGLGPTAQTLAGIAGGGITASGKGTGTRALEKTEDAITPPQPKQRIEPTFEPLPPQQLAAQARSAAGGSRRGRQILAEESSPDSATIEAAKRLGIDEYLQPDQVTTNQAYREFAQAVKSIPGSSARAQELANFEQLFKRADDLIEEIGGTTDLSTLDKSVKKRMFGIQKELETRADDLYGRIRSEVPPDTTGKAENTMAYLQRQIDELGGIEHLSTEEHRIFKRISPKEDGSLPTYANIDRLRHELTSARSKNQGPFKDMDGFIAGELESVLRRDQVSILKGNPKALDMFEDAQATVRVRKALEDDMSGLFGKNLDGSMLQGLRTGVGKLSAGDVSQFARLVRQVPEDMRESVVASGLQTAFRKNAKDGNLNFTTYSKWYEGLRKNNEAYKAFIQFLPEGAPKMLSDLYRVSNGIAKSSRERITTGRISAVTDDLRGADTLLRNIYSVTKRSGTGVGMEAITTSVGLPGAGLAAGIASALTKGKPDVLKQADALISSPAFIELTKRIGSEGVDTAAAAVARLPAFKRWAHSAGINNPQEWMQGAVQGGRLANQNSDEEE